MKKFLMRNLLGGVLAVTALSTSVVVINGVTSNTAKAQIPVTDIANFSQNIIQAIQQIASVAQETQAVINQAQQIRNQITGLANQARQLQQLPQATFDQVRNVLDDNIQELQGLLQNAEGIAMDVGAINGQFDALYPSNDDWDNQQPGVVPDYQQFYDDWNDQTTQSAKTAMEGQAVIQRVARNNQRIAQILQSSQGSDGEVRQLQSMNQMLAVVSSQLSDLTTSMTTSARLSATVQAEAAAQNAMSANMGARMNVRTPDRPVPVRQNFYHAPNR